LILCGVTQTISYIGLISTDSAFLLVILSVLSGLSFGFFPILTTMLFHLPGIKPREVALASATVFTAMWGGGALGPLLVGLVEEATGDLKLGLMISTLFPLTLVICALLLAIYKRGEKAMIGSPFSKDRTLKYKAC